MDTPEKDLNYVRNFTIKSVSTDTNKFQFNTSIARMMEFTNELSKYLKIKNKNIKFLEDTIIDFVKILAPFAPHFAEEQWELLGKKYSIFNEKWPEFDENALVKDEIEIAIQVNGKIKSKINIQTGLSEDEIKEISLSQENVKSAIGDKSVKKIIVVRGRLVNIVAK
jgi:leucyl-tRNA synthetase